MVTHLSTDIYYWSVYLSEKHFRALFEKFVGMSPKKYIIKSKLEKSLFYLRNTSLSVESIAEKLAFPSATHFIVTFTKYYNQTPMKFRKSLKQDAGINK